MQRGAEWRPRLLAMILCPAAQVYGELAEARGWQPWLSAAKVLLPPGRHGKLQAGDGFTYTAKYVPGFVSAKVWSPLATALRSLQQPCSLEFAGLALAVCGVLCQLGLFWTQPVSCHKLRGQVSFQRHRYQLCRFVPQEIRH